MCSPPSTFPTYSRGVSDLYHLAIPGVSEAFVAELNYSGTAFFIPRCWAESDGCGGRNCGRQFAGMPTLPDTQLERFSYRQRRAGELHRRFVRGEPLPDAFVTEMNPQGTSLVYSTFLGGSNGNLGNGIARGHQRQRLHCGVDVLFRFSLLSRSLIKGVGEHHGAWERFRLNGFAQQCAGRRLDPAEICLRKCNTKLTSNCDLARMFRPSVTLYERRHCPASGHGCGDDRRL